MPRTARASAGGYCYHVLNRGNARARVSHESGDYAAFLGLLGEASVRVPMRLVGYCLMPNHFHLVAWPSGDGDLSRWMHRLMTAQVGRHRLVHRTSGHVWQGRFKAFPIQEDDHLRTVLRHVERNPLRAGLVARAEDWPWSSLARPGGPPALGAGPAPRGEGWVEAVNAPMTEAECRRVRESVRRGSPLGDPNWAVATAAELGIADSLGGRGRPTPIRG